MLSALLALVARGLVVAGLLAVAALALDGRRGLDWERLVGVPDVAWAQVLLAAIGAALVLLVLRRLVRVWRTLRPRLPEDEERPEGIPMPWPLWVLAGAVVVAAMAACYWVLRLVLDRVGGGDGEVPEAPGAPGVASLVEPLPPRAAAPLPLPEAPVPPFTLSALAPESMSVPASSRIAPPLPPPLPPYFVNGG